VAGVVQDLIEADKLRTTFDVLKWDFALALVITYLLMAALFESFFYPLVIMFSVPLALGGGFLGLWLVPAMFSLMMDLRQLLTGRAAKGAATG
jgi:multidrug efflux pump subunit AcrB